MNLPQIKKEWKLIKPYNPLSSHTFNEKDRYSNVHAKSSTRVHLNKIRSEIESGEYKIRSEIESRDGYINANHVSYEGFEFITTQAPLPHTIGDFWEMIITHDITTIVMLTDFMEKGVKKADKYWSDTPLVINGVTVKLVEEKLETNLVVRKFNIDGRLINHFQYLDWKDHQSPASINSINKLIDRIDGKIVVHCSAGIGRTGTFIGCMLVKKLRTNKIYDIVKKLREDRDGMVQTFNQYKFIYKYLEKIILDDIPSLE